MDENVRGAGTISAKGVWRYPPRLMNTLAPVGREDLDMPSVGLRFLGRLPSALLLSDFNDYATSYLLRFVSSLANSRFSSGNWSVPLVNSSRLIPQLGEVNAKQVEAGDFSGIHQILFRLNSHTGIAQVLPYSAFR